jgi:hypothetical protein
MSRSEEFHVNEVDTIWSWAGGLINLSYEIAKSLVVQMRNHRSAGQSLDIHISDVECLSPRSMAGVGRQNEMRVFVSSSDILVQ